MNPKQLLFAQAYLKNPNATQAAIEAGYSKKTAKEKGYQLLQVEEIKKYLSTMRVKAESETGVDLDWCIRRFKEISDRCMTAEPVKIFVNGEWVESGEYTFDSSGANKATEMIGRHLGIFEKDNEQHKDNTLVIVRESTPQKAANG